MKKLFITVLLLCALLMPQTSYAQRDYAEEVASYMIAYDFIEHEEKDYIRIQKKIKKLRKGLDEDLLHDYAIAIAKATQLFPRVGENTIISILYMESRFKNEVRGDKKRNGNGYWSYGPMQIHLYFWGNTLEELGLKAADLYEPSKSIVFGSWLLDYWIKRKGRKKGIQYYNGANSNQYASNVMKVIRRIQHIG